jgi:predicted glycogen debranching enzyme
MADAVRVLTWKGAADVDAADPPEWLVGNGLGGYASGTVTGIITRRYHGLLVAALPVPLGRTVMLDGMTETVTLGDGRRIRLGAGQIADEDAVADTGHLEEFRLELGLPVWRFAFDGIVVERRLVVLPAQNTVLLSWRLIEGAASLRLSLRPFAHVRPLDGRVSDPSRRTYRVISQGDRHELAVGDDLPTVKLHLKGDAASLILDGGARREIFYAWESRRGYDFRGGVWSRGFFEVTLTPERPVVLTVSTETWERATALRPAEAADQERARRRALINAAHPALREGPAAELVLAADGFIVAARAPRHCRRRRSVPHRHRRLPLVHRLGSGYDDQPRGADAGHRPA